MTVAQRERAALVATFRDVPPDAPTLCEGWDVRDLTAHLVVRERRLDAAPGIMIPALAGYTERVQRQVAESTDWDVLLNQVAEGPPLYSPFKVLDPIANVAEMFIHHEDVRRAKAGAQAPRRADGLGAAQAGRDDGQDDVAQGARPRRLPHPAGRHRGHRRTRRGGDRHRGPRRAADVRRRPR
ncbi:TIGR03085 family metal-binding protein [Mycolicibacterium vanbaalenii]|uniref:TIGR03085 family metal-binding protein n=1 Tax=Mycolicibacterium vanbaalenii TaxID=110539 RepID=UPI003B8A5A8A